MKLPYPLILASTSKYRGALLAQLGWEFEAIAPGVDEDQIKHQNLEPSEIAKVLSKLKAQAVFSKRKEACVIGSDQVCHLDGEILGKPGTHEIALEQLLKMQGKTHKLLTAVTILCPDHQVTFINTTTLVMRPLSLKALQDYVTVDLPLDCAGSYKLESRGIKLFQKIETEDHTAIIGLPLIELGNHLVKWGYPI